MSSAYPSKGGAPLCGSTPYTSTKAQSTHPCASWPGSPQPSKSLCLIAFSDVFPPISTRDSRLLLSSENLTLLSPHFKSLPPSFSKFRSVFIKEGEREEGYGPPAALHKPARFSENFLLSQEHIDTALAKGGAASGHTDLR